jgi:hypothetical protein
MEKNLGNFSINKKGVQTMYQQIANNKLHDYVMVEVKSKFFKLFWDFEIYDIYFPHFKKIDLEEFWN